jgi:nucleoside-diphosphate-sugar epimerase
MRILLTGASGFTGRHLAKLAVSQGHELVPFTADLTDTAAVTQAVVAAGPVDAVVHLAALSFVGHTNAEAFYAVNTVGTTHLLSALSALPATERPSSVLLASSANVYGNCPRSPIPESQPPAPVNHYGASKLAMEHMALTYVDRLPIVITRSFNYTGPGQATTFLIPKLVHHFQHRSLWVELGNTQVEREFNDVRLVTDTFLKLLCTGAPGEIYNVCSGHTFSLDAVLKMLMEITGHEVQVKVNPQLVRHNEVLRLCGDPGKLCHTIGDLPSFSLADCLRLMLTSKSQPAFSTS